MNPWIDLGLKTHPTVVLNATGGLKYMEILSTPFRVQTDKTSNFVDLFACFPFMVCIYRDLGVPKNTSVFSGVLVFRRTREMVDYIEVPS